MRCSLYMEAAVEDLTWTPQRDYDTLVNPLKIKYLKLISLMDVCTKEQYKLCRLSLVINNYHRML